MVHVTRQGVDWRCVQYMLGEIQYGGRIADDIDRRLMRAICRRWFTDEILQPSFEFHAGFKLPRCSTIDEYLEFFDTLPDDVGLCEVLGLPRIAQSA
jgi:dynein heavy chain